MIRFPRVSTRLAARLALVVAAFMLALLVTVGTAVNTGLGRLQTHAEQRGVSMFLQDRRSAVGRQAVNEAGMSNAQLAQAANLTRIAAEYLAARHAAGDTPSSGSDQLATYARDGLRYDADPERATDLVVPGYADLGAAQQRRIAESAALDTLFPSLLPLSPDAIGIYFQEQDMAVRWYPVINLVERLAGSPGIRPELQNWVREGSPAAPVNNPSRATVWDAPYVDNAGHGLLITANTPVYYDDAYQGIVSIDISLERLVNRLATIRPTPGSYAFLMDQDGGLIAVAPSGMSRLLDRPIPADQDPLSSLLGVSLLRSSNAELVRVAQDMRNAGNGLAELTLGGEEVWLTYAPLPDLGWTLAIVAPADEVMAPATSLVAQLNQNAREISQTTLALVIGFFLIALFGAVLSTRRLTRPIATLVGGTQAIAAGDLAVTLPVDSRDELGVLAHSFNDMAAALRRSHQRLEQQNQVLAAEVAERQQAEAALHDSTERYRRVFETSSDGLFISTMDGRLVDFNPATARLHGYASEEFSGLQPAELFAPASRSVFAEGIGMVRRGESFRAETTNVRHDGSCFPAALFGTGIVVNGGLHFLGAVRDVSEEARAMALLEQRVAERTNELSSVLAIAQTVASTLELQPLLGLILDQLQPLVAYSAASVLTLDEADQRLRQVEYRGPAEAADEGYCRFLLDPEDATWQALCRGEVVFVAGDEAPDRRSSVPSMRSDTWIGVPLCLKERLIGILALRFAQANQEMTNRARLAQAVATQAAIAIENARLYTEAQGKAALEERQKLARELHDSVSQALYGIALGARTARTLLDRDPSRVADPLEYVLSLAEAGLAEMRALIFELRPESLESEGLGAALRKQTASLKARHNLDVALSLCDEPEVGLPIKEALYRIAQEALHNTIKHARATAIDVRMERTADLLRVVVCDNGIGFDPNGAFPGHLGLTSMRERITRVGGSISVQSAPGQGTIVCAVVPSARPTA